MSLRLQPASDHPLMRVERLTVDFRGARRPGGLRAVDDVTIEIDAGEVLGIVGKSGSGKTTLGKAILRLIRPTSGRILFRGVDIAGAPERTLRPFRQHMQMVFQDPLSSFNPRMTIGQALALPVRLHRLCTLREIPQRLTTVMERVGLLPQHLERYPHELSGGQLQRAAICRALLLSPSLLVADEAVSKLDVSVRAQILNLLRDIQRDLSLSVLFITHDLRVARYLCDRIAVMYLGRLVELGPTRGVFEHPRHPYTRALLGSADTALVPETTATSDAAAATGCGYYGACPMRMPLCRTVRPDLRILPNGDEVACHQVAPDPATAP